MHSVKVQWTADGIQLSLQFSVQLTVNSRIDIKLHCRKYATVMKNNSQVPVTLTGNVDLVEKKKIWSVFWMYKQYKYKYDIETIKDLVLPLNYEEQILTPQHKAKKWVCTCCLKVLSIGHCKSCKCREAEC